MPENIKLAISACLLGEKVRYDGGHRLDPFLRDTLGRFVEYVPVCPEVECGLGVPRVDDAGKVGRIFRAAADVRAEHLGEQGLQFVREAQE